MESLLRNWSPDVHADDVLRGQGADPAKLRKRSPRAAEAVDRAVCEGRRLITPLVLQQRLRIHERRHEKLVLSDGGKVFGSLVARQLQGADEVTAVVCTIGSRLESRVARTIRRDPAYAVALEDFGVLVIGSLVKAVTGWVQEQADAEGLHMTMPLSPGMEGWPVADGQRQMFGMLNGLGRAVVLNESSYMVPRMSTSFLLGLGRNVAEPVGTPCDCCSLGDRCSYRSQYG